MWLFVMRVLRSLSQGYLGIILPLYLVALGYGAEALGVLLAVSAVVAAGISTVVGVLADRFGRKPFLVVISLLLAFGTFGFAYAHSFVWIVTFAAIASIGRGGALAGGAWGPFYPAVQALVAEHTTDYNRTTVFGAFSFVGVMAAALGSALAALPSLMRHFVGLDELTGYRILFVLSGVFGLAMALAVFPINENRALELELADELAREQQQRERPREGLVLGLSPASWRLVLRFMITNATNGLAIGMLGPIVVYWFYRRFGVSSAQLAGVFFAMNLVTAIPYLMAGRLALWMGSVRSVVATRAVSTVLDVRRRADAELRSGRAGVRHPRRLQRTFDPRAAILPDGRDRPGRALERFRPRQLSVASHVGGRAIHGRLFHGASDAVAAAGVRGRDARHQHRAVLPVFPQRLPARRNRRSRSPQENLAGSISFAPAAIARLNTASESSK